MGCYRSLITAHSLLANWGPIHAVLDRSAMVPARARSTAACSFEMWPRSLPESFQGMQRRSGLGLSAEVTPSMQARLRDRGELAVHRETLAETLSRVPALRDRPCTA